MVFLLAAAACGGGAGGGGFAGSVGRGTGGGSGTGGSGGALAPPNDAHTFCTDQLLETCDIAFRCVPATDRTADFTATFGSSLSQCRTTVVPSACATAASDCPYYDAVEGSACITALAAYTCDDLAAGVSPAACDYACPISPGTGGSSGTGGFAGGTGGASGTGGRVGSGGAIGSGGQMGSGGTVGTGGRGSGGASSGSGGSDQLPLCPSDYETASCPTAGVSCRLTCDSGICGCTCQTLGDRNLWSCVIF